MKVKVLILTLFACLLFSSLTFADDLILSINGQYVDNDDRIVEESGVLYAQVVEFASNIGVDVRWLKNAKLAVLLIGEDYVSFGIDSNQLIINNIRYEMENASIVRNGRMYAPIDVLFEKLSIGYTWDDQLRHISITSEALTVNPEIIRQVYSYTEEDLLWLARIIEVEARGNSLEGKTAVGNVVMNRVASPRFPNSIYEVIYQRGQFPPAYRSTFAKSTPTDHSFIAAKRALLGVQVAKDCLFFNYIPFSTKKDDFYRFIEGNYFYY